MIRPLCVGGTALGILLTIVACKDQEACEKARLKMEAQWAEVRNTAASLKTPKSFEELTEVQKKQRHDAWLKVEQKAELLRSSFETVQITWDAARKAQRELARVYSDVPQGGGALAESFPRLLNQTSQQLAQYEGECR
jgi:hypothetical protein